MNDWDEIREIGYDAWMNNIEHKDNPYPFSEDVNSLYAAWHCGWLEADNDSYEATYIAPYW